MADSNRVISAQQPLVSSNGMVTPSWFRFFEALARPVAADDDDGDISGGFVPTRIAAGETFTVPEDRQALFRMPITNEGTLLVSGYLVEV